MKITRNLIITNKDSYLNQDQAIMASIILNSDFNAPTQIIATGKEKWAITLDEQEMPVVRYQKIKEVLKKIQLEIYKTNTKHERRRKRQLEHEKRMEEEIKINEKAIRLSKKKAIN